MNDEQLKTLFSSMIFTSKTQFLIQKANNENGSVTYTIRAKKIAQFENYTVTYEEFCIYNYDHSDSTQSTFKNITATEFILRDCNDKFKNFSSKSADLLTANFKVIDYSKLIEQIKAQHDRTCEFVYL